MTDLEKLQALLTDFGLKFDTAKSLGAPGFDVTIYGGYTGFYTEFEFDAAGKFVRHGAWE